MPKITLHKPAPPFYQTGNPPETGVYACRVELGYNETFLKWEDVFLLWEQRDQRWYYLSSDASCRRKVAGWIGPLPRFPKTKHDAK